MRHLSVGRDQLRGGSRTTLAEIALVLSPSRDSLSPDILLVIRTMIVNGVFLAFLALFPWILGSGTLPPTEIWRWSSGASVFGVLFVVSPIYAREQRALGPLQDTGLVRLSLVTWSLAGLMMLVHVANLLGWPLSPSFSAFYLGLWIGLSVPGIAFVFLISRLLR
jgi:hypothetical protein